jgi:hypothetical protein
VSTTYPDRCERLLAVIRGLREREKQLLGNIRGLESALQVARDDLARARAERDRAHEEGYAEGRRVADPDYVPW